jgi:hypothetical protein
MKTAAGNPGGSKSHEGALGFPLDRSSRPGNPQVDPNLGQPHAEGSSPQYWSTEALHSRSFSRPSPVRPRAQANGYRSELVPPSLTWSRGDTLHQAVSVRIPHAIRRRVIGLRSSPREAETNDFEWGHRAAASNVPGASDSRAACRQRASRPADRRPVAGDWEHVAWRWALLDAGPPSRHFSSAFPRRSFTESAMRVLRSRIYGDAADGVRQAIVYATPPVILWCGQARTALLLAPSRRDPPSTG